MGTGRELLLRPVVIHHGRRCSDEEGHGRGRKKTPGNACSPEGEGWQEVSGPCHGRPQGDDQDYELKELNERRKLQLRNKAIKKGLDPEAFCGSHPPKIHMFSKYERRTDTRTYGDRKKLYEGGAEIVRAEWLEQMRKEKVGEWNKRPKAKLPKWCGVRPGKKEGDPETPEGEEEAADDAAEEEYDEEEEEYDEEEEEE